MCSGMLSEYLKVYHAASTSVKLTIDNKRNIILHGVKWGQFIIRIDKGLKPLVSIYEAKLSSSSK
jgi:hypothetical protein